MMVQLPPASTTGLAASAGRATMPDFLVALLIALALSAPLLQLWLPPVTGMMALVFAAVWFLARRQIGGYSGDVLGAVQQACEIAVLLTILAR